MNVGDVVKYVGEENAKESGKFLPHWMPCFWYERGEVGIIYRKWTMKYSTLCGIQMVNKYDVRMVSRYHYLVHHSEVFYEFELEKA